LASVAVGFCSLDITSCEMLHAYVQPASFNIILISHLKMIGHFKELCSNQRTKLLNQIMLQMTTVTQVKSMTGQGGKHRLNCHLQLLILNSWFWSQLLRHDHPSWSMISHSFNMIIHLEASLRLNLTQWLTSRKLGAWVLSELNSNEKVPIRVRPCCHVPLLVTSHNQTFHQRHYGVRLPPIRFACKDLWWIMMKYISKHQCQSSWPTSICSNPKCKLASSYSPHKCKTLHCPNGPLAWGEKNQIRRHETGSGSTMHLIKKKNAQRVNKAT
jgi:hypothetical protein